MLDEQIKNFIKDNGLSADAAKLEAYKQLRQLASKGICEALANCKEISNEEHEVRFTISIY